MPEERIHRLFEIGLLLKALHSLVEIVGALILAAVSRGTLLKIAELVTRGELHEDPNDLIANHVLHFAQNFSVSAKAATVLFLLSHGMIKLVLVVAVMQRRQWAYPAFMLALGVLIGIQLHQLSQNVSVALLVVTIIDLLVLALTWHEYRIVRHAAASP